VTNVKALEIDTVAIAARFEIIDHIISQHRWVIARHQYAVVISKWPVLGAQFALVAAA
jgi:hypothetical protein